MEMKPLARLTVTALLWALALTGLAFLATRGYV